MLLRKPEAVIDVAYALQKTAIKGRADVIQGLQEFRQIRNTYTGRPGKTNAEKQLRLYESLIQYFGFKPAEIRVS